MVQCSSTLHCPQKGEMRKSRKVALQEKMMSQKPFPLLSQERLQRVRSAPSDTAQKGTLGKKELRQISLWKSMHTSMLQLDSVTQLPAFHPTALVGTCRSPHRQVTELESLLAHTFAAPDRK